MTALQTQMEVLLKETKSLSHLLNESDTKLQNIIKAADKLQGKMLPINEEMAALQKKKSDYERCLKVLYETQTYHRTSNEVESIIHDHPDNNLKQYIKAMNRIKDSIVYFQNNFADHAELSQLKSLYDTGISSLEELFATILKRNENVPTSELCFELIGGKDKDALLPLEKLSLPVFLSAEAKTIFFTITQFLAKENRADAYINKYCEMRSNIIIAALQNVKDAYLEDDEQNNVGSSPHILPASPSLIRRTTATPKRPTKRPMSHKRVDHLKGNTPDGFVRRQLSVTLSLNEELTDELSNEAFGLLLFVFVRLAQIEITYLLQLNLTQQQPNGGTKLNEHRVVCDRLLAAPLEWIQREVSSINSRAHQASVSNEFGHVLQLYPLFTRMRQVESELNAVLANCSSDMANKWTSCYKLLVGTSNRMLDQYTEFVKTQAKNLGNMPKDGTVHELTSNLMRFLQTLHDQGDIVGELLLAEGSIDKDMTPSKRLGEYIAKMLATLGLTLSNASVSYPDEGLKSIFLLNNYHHMHKTLKHADMLNTVEKWNCEVNKYFSNKTQDAKRAYSQSWTKVLYYVLEVHHPVSQQRTAPEMSKTMVDKDKDAIKEKWKGFRVEMETLHKVQKQYTIPDKVLRLELVQETKDFVLPKYSMFRNKYLNVPFTSKKDKYIRYSEDDISRMIDELFVG